MSLPPVLSAIGDKVIEVNSELSFTISATDPESDAKTYSALYLESGMTFSPSTREFAWTPDSGNLGHSYWVVFRVTTPSGGTDAEVVKISVIADGLRSDRNRETGMPHVVTDGSLLTIQAEGRQNQVATLLIYSISGRRIGSVTGTGGSYLRWDGFDTQGRRVAAGVYMYRVVVGEAQLQGKVVVLRKW
jgi:hypothetical protein